MNNIFDYLIFEKLLNDLSGQFGKFSRALNDSSVKEIDEETNDIKSVVAKVTHLYKKEQTYSKLIDINDPKIMECGNIHRLKEKVKDLVIKSPCKKQRPDGTEYDSWNYVFDDHKPYGSDLIEEVFDCPEEIVKNWRKVNRVSDRGVVTPAEAERLKSEPHAYTRTYSGKSLWNIAHGQDYNRVEIDHCYREFVFDFNKMYKCWVVDIDGRGGPDSEYILFVEGTT